MSDYTNFHFKCVLINYYIYLLLWKKNFSPHILFSLLNITVLITCTSWPCENNLLFHLTTWITHGRQEKNQWFGKFVTYQPADKFLFSGCLDFPKCAPSLSVRINNHLPSLKRFYDKWYCQVEHWTSLITILWVCHSE